MPVTQNKGIDLAWYEHGAAGSPVLMIMGATFSSALWYPSIPALSERHRLIRFDNRGTGGSQATQRASVQDMAQDALAVLTAAGLSSAHVYGVSLGGVVALELARQAPEAVDSLILGCTGILSAEKRRPPKLADIRLRIPQHKLARLMSKPLYGPVATKEQRLRDLDYLRRDRTDRTGLIAQQDAFREYRIDADDVGRMNIPALVLHGSHDGIIPVSWGKELAATLPNSALRIYEQVGHNYLVAASNQANDDVLAFLARVDENTHQEDGGQTSGVR